MARKTTGYSSIPSIEEDNFGEMESPKKAKFVSIIIIAIFTGLILATSINYAANRSERLPHNSSFDVPAGVNLASWLALEDYFFVGDDGAIEVATFEGNIVANCLPPLHVGSTTGPMWNSETDLLAGLIRTGSVRSAIKTFEAFRTSYLDFDEDIPTIRNLGILRVRVPISWCLTDYDPTHDDILNQSIENDDGSDDVLLRERYFCKDPFYDDVDWPAIPKPFLQKFLQACAKYGIKATLDIHTYPGGTSLGTFSGVWPKKPLFWEYDDPQNPDTDVGRSIYNDFLGWIESLSDSDPRAFSGIGAITPMNEPGHLAGLFGPGSSHPEKESFLPVLPIEMAKEYLAKINSLVEESPSYISVPDGPHLRSLLWQGDALSLFRNSTLPSKGIELHINVHESIFVESLVAEDPFDEGGRHPKGTKMFAAWWRGTTTAIERSTWAVLDMHHYHAWESVCQGTVDGPPEANYTCLDTEARNEALERCASWAGMYRDIADEQLGGGLKARLASGEFSASTHHSVLRSCLDITTLRTSYQKQLEAANDADIDLFWWSWKMPFGGAFRRAWSFKHFLYLLGVDGFSSADVSELPCGN